MHQLAVVLHAKATGLQAIDTVFVDLNAPEDQLIAETELVLKMGYTGKLAIHPKQVEPMQRVFTPTPAEIASAQRLIAAHDSHQAAGTGVFELYYEIFGVLHLLSCRYAGGC